MVVVLLLLVRTVVMVVLYHLSPTNVTSIIKASIRNAHLTHPSLEMSSKKLSSCALSLSFSAYALHVLAQSGIVLHRGQRSV